MLKNKLQSLKSHLKKLKFIHILLIILILVVFFGLFKREIGIWSVRNLPAVKIKTIEQNYPCKKEVVNPVWDAEYNRLIKDCEWTTIAESLKCANETNAKIKAPVHLEEESTCTGILREQWFWAFGRYWFKVE